MPSVRKFKERKSAVTRSEHHRQWKQSCMNEELNVPLSWSSQSCSQLRTRGNHHSRLTVFCIDSSHFYLSISLLDQSLSYRSFLQCVHRGTVQYVHKVKNIEHLLKSWIKMLIYSSVKLKTLHRSLVFSNSNKSDYSSEATPGVCTELASPDGFKKPKPSVWLF